jgi:hypothetical protein
MEIGSTEKENLRNIYYRTYTSSLNLRLKPLQKLTHKTWD